MKLKDLLYKVDVRLGSDSVDNILINKVEFDSRKIQKDDLFIAIKGNQLDGHDFIEQAIKNGAIAVLCQDESVNRIEGVCYIFVEDSSYSMSFISGNFYNNPSRSIKVIGVTGTNGKTTIVTLLHQLFTDMGYPVGMLSTIENKILLKSEKSSHTTSDSITINRMLSQMIQAGCEYCFMEVSSHAIHQNRVSNIYFKGGIFTNITHEHLDYHESFKDYIYTKKKFFDSLDSTSFALTNKDDKNGLLMVSNTEAVKLTYSINSIADYKCKILESRLDGILLNLDNREVWVKLIGRFNASNLLAIYATSVQLGLNHEDTLHKISNLQSVEGRFQTIRNEEDITGIVDYAHTPDAYKNVLSTIRNINRDLGKLIIVFGCGGDRDKQKRPIMTSIAAEIADNIILTSDNPRTEDVNEIISDMMVNLDPAQKKKILVIIDRKEAIKTASTLANQGDVILLAGKGHEKYQEVKGVRYPFDDMDELKRSLNIKTN